MKDNKEVVLFFDINTNFDSLSVAKELSSRYPELGNPTILPPTNDPKSPLIVFKENPDFRLVASLANVNFIINHTYFDNIASIAFDMVDAFEEFKSSFTRIGYISNIFLPSKSIEKVKNKYLNEEEINDVVDFNLSWYRELNTKLETLNCWERFITDHHDFDDLLCQYDINTPAGKSIDMNMKFLKNFFKESNDYIEKRIDL